jgi:hypothetical protein
MTGVPECGSAFKTIHAESADDIAERYVVGRKGMLNDLMIEALGACKLSHGIVPCYGSPCGKAFDVDRGNVNNAGGVDTEFLVFFVYRKEHKAVAEEIDAVGLLVGCGNDGYFRRNTLMIF